MSIFDKYVGVKPIIVNAHRIGKKRDPRPNVRPMKSFLFGRSQRIILNGLHLTGLK